jgi:hypothetical protein
MSETMNEPAAGRPAAPEPEAPAEDEWTGPSPEEWQATQERLQQLEPLAETWQQFEQQQPEPHQQQGQVQLPDGTLLSEQDVEFLRSMWMQDVAPVYDYTEQSQLAETEERARTSSPTSPPGTTSSSRTSARRSGFATAPTPTSSRPSPARRRPSRRRGRTRDGLQRVPRDRRRS